MKWWLIPLQIVTLSLTANAAFYTCDGSLTDCQNKVNGAANGDTVTINPGTFTWTNKLTVTNMNIILQGAGMFDGASNTTITGTGNSGNFIDYITTNDTHTAYLQKIEFKVDNSTVTPTLQEVTIEGTSVYNSVANNSGFRMTQCRFTAVNMTSHAPPYLVVVDDFVSGVIDHCWWDFDRNAPNGGVIDVNQNSSPNQRAQSSGGPLPGSPPTGGFIPHMGLWSYSQAYTWGDTSFPEIYFEDNLVCRKNLGNAGADTGTSDFRGGTKYVTRHNSSWGIIFNSHGFGESGAQASTYVTTIYNNVADTPSDTSFQPENFRTGSAVDFNNRFLGGLGTHAGGWNNIQHVLSPTFNRLTDPGNLIGPADGTNYFDVNAKGTLYLDTNNQPWYGVPSGAAHTYTNDGLTQSTDPRVGDIYWRSSNAGPSGANSLNVCPYSHTAYHCPGTTGPLNNHGQTYTLYGLTGISLNELIGFTIRDDTIAGDNCDGSNTTSPDCNGGQVLTNDRCALIVTNSASYGTPVANQVDITITVGHDAPACLLGNAAGMAASDRWTLRYVKTFLGAPGGSQMGGHYMNGGGIFNAPTFAGTLPAFLDSITLPVVGPVFQYYPGQTAEGFYTWDTMYSQNHGIDWHASIVQPLGVAQGRMPSGATYNSGTVKPPLVGLYTATGNTVANCRIGADPNFWNAVDGANGSVKFGMPISYGQNFDSGQAEFNANCGVVPTPTATPSASPTATPTPTATGTPTCGATKHLAVPYPHPLVSGNAPPPTPTASPTPTATATATSTPTATATATSTATPTPTFTPPTPTPTPSFTPTATATFTPTPTPTPSATYTPTPTPTASPTPTPIFSNCGICTPTPTAHP